MNDAYYDRGRARAHRDLSARQKDALSWPSASDETAWRALASRAAQLEMLDADLRHNAEWETTMRELVGLGLGHDEFTERRMAALKEWQRRRKLAQEHIRYAYNPRKRRWGLIRRDVRRQLRKDGESA